MILDIAYHWGSTSKDRLTEFPCDKYLPNSEDVYFRAVNVSAPPAIFFRWLCQLKVAPYSYDWLDNFGKQSPRYLISGVEYLKIGQNILGFFNLVEFERDRHLTMVIDAKREPIYGKITISYTVISPTKDTCRCVVKVRIIYPKHGIWCLMPWFLPLADAIMMRKQLLNLKNLAEQQVAYQTIKYRT